MSDTVRNYLDRVSVETMREWLFHIAKDPLPRRTMNYTRPGASKPTLYEADDYLAERLAEWGYTTEREPCQVQAYRRDPDKPSWRPTATAHSRTRCEWPFVYGSLASSASARVTSAA